MKRNTLTVVFYRFIRPTTKLAISRWVDLEKTTNWIAINRHP